MKHFMILLMVSALAGCAALDGLMNVGAQANDQAVVSAESTLCRAISIGAWKRQYGGDPERAAAWRALCEDKVGALP